MTTELVAQPKTVALSVGMDREQLELLKRTICEEATDDEYLMFVGICKRSGLDPFAKQIYFRKYRKKDGGSRVTVITGIDGYRLIAQRTGEYEGQTQPEWCGSDGVWKTIWLEKTPPAAARVGVWRKNFREPTYAIAKWSEYYPSQPNERFIWDKMPANQLAKCAEALSLRKAFPSELSGMYVKEEMDQAENSASPAKSTTAPGLTASTPMSTGTSETGKPKFPRANTIAHDGTMASHRQVAYLHGLRSKIGGLDVCGKEHPCYDDDGKRINPTRGMCLYHKQLAAFKDCDNRPIHTSTNLSESQISSLIDRYESKLAQQEARAAEQPDLEAAFDRAEGYEAEDAARFRLELGPGSDG